MYLRSAVIRKLDFEIGYLVKSPCKQCYLHPISFPICLDTCEYIDQIQTVLAPTISSIRSSGSSEANYVGDSGLDGS